MPEFYAPSPITGGVCLLPSCFHTLDVLTGQSCGSLYRSHDSRALVRAGSGFKCIKSDPLGGVVVGVTSSEIVVFKQVDEEEFLFLEEFRSGTCCDVMGPQVVVGRELGRVEVRNLEGGKVWESRDNELYCEDVRFVRAGEVVGVGGGEMVWHDVRTNSVVAATRAHVFYGKAARFSCVALQGNAVAIGGWDGEVALFDGRKFEKPTGVFRQNGAVTDLVFRSESEVLSVGQDGFLHVWDTARRTEKKLNMGGSLRGVALLNSIVVIARDDGFIKTDIKLIDAQDALVRF